MEQKNSLSTGFAHFVKAITVGLGIPCMHNWITSSRCFAKMTDLKNGCCGLRLLECNRLRFMGVDLGEGLVFVRRGKGGKMRRNSEHRKMLLKELCRSPSEAAAQYNSFYSFPALFRAQTAPRYEITIRAGQENIRNISIIYLLLIMR